MYPDNNSKSYQCPYCGKTLDMEATQENNSNEVITDYGPDPFVFNIEEATKGNENFRTALWSGDHLQLTLMSLEPGEEIGVENHANVDQFLRVEDGIGMVMIGNTQDNLDFQYPVDSDFAIIIPAGTWHNLLNTGDGPLKLYSIYAPPQHPWNTVHVTKPEEDHN